MKLYFMRQDALETLKSNLSETYALYYTDKSNKWLWDVCDGDPFVEFREIPDFSLAPLDAGLSKGEINLENCKIIYRNLMFITESQASDERLWAGLTHGVFYDYMRKRWEYDKSSPKTPEKAVRGIKTRYFFDGGIRGGFYRNTLSKCWWIGRALYDGTKTNPFEKLDILGDYDFSSKTTEIFFSYSFSSNPDILNGIIKCFEYFHSNGMKISVRDQLRPSMQLLNAVGGGVILDCLSSDEIAEIMIENIERILQGDELELGNAAEEDNENEEDDGIEEETPDESELYVTAGCKVKAVDEETGEETLYKADLKNGKLPPVMRSILGKKIGDSFEVNNRKMRIVNITINQ